MKIRLPRLHLKMLTALSVTLTLTYLYSIPYIFYHDSDPLTYFRKAWLLLGRPGGFDVASRGPGYPVWLILTGAASLDTWWLLMASQVLMAMLFPLLVYGILAQLSRSAGVFAALLFMGFGLPYIHMTWVMTEQLFLFVELTALLLISRYFSGAAQRYAEAPVHLSGRCGRLAARFRMFLASPYPIALLLAYDMMIKPAAGPFFWIFIVVCLLFRVAPWRRYIGPIAMYVVIMTAWSVIDYYHGWARFPTIARPVSGAQRVFADAYYGNGQAIFDTSRPFIAAADGPASRELYRAVTQASAALRRSAKWNTQDSVTRERLYLRFTNPEELAAEAFARPNPLYFMMITQAAAASGGDRLLKEVAREHGRAGIAGLVHYFAVHPMATLMGPPNPYVGYMLLSKFFRYKHMRADGFIGVRDLLLPLESPNMVEEKNGPASRSYAGSVRYFIDTFPELLNWKAYQRDCGDSEELKRFMLESPRVTPRSASVMGTVYTWLSMLRGEAAAGHLMGATALEIVRNKPVSWGFFVGDFLAVTAYGEGGEFKANLSGFLKGAYAEFLRIRNAQEEMLRERVESSSTSQLPPSLTRDLGRYNLDRSVVQQTLSAGLLIQHSAFSWAKPIWLFGTLIAATALLVTGIGMRLVTFLTLAYFASAAALTIVIIPPTGDPRQEEFFSFFPLLIISLALAVFPRMVRRCTQAVLVPVALP